MEAPYQIVGSVIASKPAADLIEAFVAKVRRERAFVLAKSTQGATFVRFNAADAALVVAACRALRGPAAALLRLGFAVGYKDQASGGAPEGLDLSARSVEQANELAAAANDGEVLVAPQFAVAMIDAGLALRTRTLQLAGGRSAVACAIELRGEGRDAPAGERRPKVPAPTEAAGAAGDLMRGLLAQADDMARRQGEIEARQDALLARMTLVEEGSKPSVQMGALEAELQAQFARVEERLEFIGKLEHRLTRMQSLAADLDRKLGEQLRRRAEVDNLKALADTLVEQMVQAHAKLDALTQAQERLAPFAAEVRSLARVVEDSQRALAAQTSRFAELESRGAALAGKLTEVAGTEARLHDIKADIEQIRDLGAQGRADLMFLTEREGEVATLVARVDALAARAEEAEGRVQFIESRRELVEEVRAHAEAATHLLGDMQVKLDILNEQRAVVDHALEKLARLDYSAQEAQNTLRALQRERELAERIASGIKALRARPVS